MPRSCSVCCHPERKRIDAALIEGVSLRDIAGQFSVSKSAIARHKDEHLPARMTKSAQAKEVTAADRLLTRLSTLLEQADDQYNAARGLAGEAIKEGDLRAASSALGVGNGAIREARAIVETLLEVEGELDRRATVNMLVTAEFGQVAAALMDALSPYPAARIAAASALERLEASNGHRA